MPIAAVIAKTKPADRKRPRPGRGAEARGASAPWRRAGVDRGGLGACSRIDLGTVRVGLALSDPLRITGQPMGRLPRRALRDDLHALIDLRQRRTMSPSSSSGTRS